MAAEGRAVSETRKLAAILVSDVAGYSRLAGADEDRTLARLRTLRSDLIDPIIAVHNGRVVKRTGDGSIVDFRSVVDAVRCAIEIQTGLIERNAGLPPEKRIDFRVGIHVGDVVEESDGDLMGDGVNIAARLEGIANPGAICLSEDAYRQVSGRLDMEVTDLGPTKLKNIEKPIRAYSLVVGKPALAKPAKAGAPFRRSTAVLLVAGVAALIAIAAGAWHFLGANRAPLAEAAPLSIVVLPFSNLSGDASQDYLGDVLTEELTTSLSRLPGSFVVSRTTAFSYRGKAMGVKQIGKELGVRYVLEGSAQKSGTHVRVDAQLIDAVTGAHLWADQFDAAETDLLTMQDEIVTRLARALQVELTAAEASRVARAHPENPDAEELALQCEAAYLRLGLQRKEMLPAYALCEQALRIDKDNVRALAILALRLSVQVFNLQSVDPQADRLRADELISRALAVDSNNYLAHYAKSWFLAPQRPEEAIVEAERTLALNPSFLPVYTSLWIANWAAGRLEKADEYADAALRLGPHDSLAYVFLNDKGMGLFTLSRYEEATDFFKHAIAVNPEYALAYIRLTASLALSGHDAEARDTLRRYLAMPLDVPKTIAQFKARQPDDTPNLRSYHDRLYEGLRKAGLPEE
jgi:adenylate cyclase